jgi:hypothetical protein
LGATCGRRADRIRLARDAFQGRLEIAGVGIPELEGVEIRGSLELLPLVRLLLSCLPVPTVVSAKACLYGVARRPGGRSDAGWKDSDDEGPKIDNTVQGGRVKY